MSNPHSQLDAKERFERQVVYGKIFGVANNTVCRIQTGKIWGWLK